jgi:hypothetical protein
MIQKFYRIFFKIRGKNSHRGTKSPKVRKNPPKYYRIILEFTYYLRHRIAFSPFRVIKAKKIWTYIFEITIDNEIKSNIPENKKILA